jgi:hypothetical protein
VADGVRHDGRLTVARPLTVLRYIFLGGAMRLHTSALLRHLAPASVPTARTGLTSPRSRTCYRFEDVRDRADDILGGLEDGSMPCDGSWPADRIPTFRKWIGDGKRP